jgi:hypothetical protein
LFSRSNAEDDRRIAIDRATVAVLQIHAPDMVERYKADDLGPWLQRRLDNATTAAEAIAGDPEEAGYVDRYRAALAVLIAATK